MITKYKESKYQSLWGAIVKWCNDAGIMINEWECVPEYVLRLGMAREIVSFYTATGIEIKAYTTESGNGFYEIHSVNITKDDDEDD